MKWAGDLPFGLAWVDMDIYLSTSKEVDGKRLWRVFLAHARAFVVIVVTQQLCFVSVSNINRRTRDYHTYKFIQEIIYHTYKFIH